MRRRSVLLTIGFVGVFALGALAGRLNVAERLTGALRALSRSVGLSSRSGGQAPSRAARPAERSATPQGLSLWVADDSTKVFPGDDLGVSVPVGTKAAAVTLEGARGETVAFQLVLASDAGSSAVHVELGDLKGPAGKIGRERIDVFLEARLACPPVADKVVSDGPGAYPDPLIPLWEDGVGTRPIASPFAVPAKQNTVLWLDVRIPRGVAAGRYRGDVVLEAAEHEPFRVRVELAVWDFDIPAAPSLDAWIPLYWTRLEKREDFDGLEDAEGEAAIAKLLWRYFRMAHQHRFVTQIQEEEHEVEWNRGTGELIEIDWPSYDALYGPVLDGSLFEDKEPPSVWKVGGNTWWGARPGDPPNFGAYYKEIKELLPAHRRALITYAREIARHFKERGWSRPRLFMYMIDEPDFDEHPNTPYLVKAYGEALDASGAPIDHLVTIAPQESPVPRGSVDIWASWAGGYVPSLMRARQELGERAWFYQQHEPFVGGHCINDEGLGMRSWPWIAWRYGVDGIFLWAGDFWNKDPYRDPENWSSNLLGNGVLFYPGALLPTIGYPAMRGPVPSFRMKALRRGLFDYEYFALLLRLGGNPDALVGRIIRSALNEGAWSPHWKHPLWASRGDWSHDPAEWDAVRRQVARLIVERSERRHMP